MSAKIAAANVRIKRAYEAPGPADGARILVDRLWPRGLSKAQAAVDQWIREVAPSTGLRKWFGHDPGRWQEFRRRYAAELRNHKRELRAVRAQARKGPVTLVYSAHDKEHNDAHVLRDVLLGRSIGR
jgi:uncharacterized protein YeaO (DUF488 family)